MSKPLSHLRFFLSTFLLLKIARGAEGEIPLRFLTPSPPLPSHTVLILPSVACTVNPYLMKIKTPAWDLLWRHIRPVLVSIYGVFQKKIVLCPRCTATNPSTIYRNASVQSLKFSERPIEAQFWQGWGGKILKFFGKKQNIVWSPYICVYFIWILDFYRSS